MIYTYKEYSRLTQMSLADKELWSQQVILNAIKNSKHHSVSLSWGKDSVVMLHLIRKFCKNSEVIFANTGCEYPETYKYRDQMLESDFSGISYHETKPIKTFWQCVEEYGFPEKRESDTKLGKKANRTPQCCMYLKEKPLRNKQAELKVDTVFIGLQATESMNRRLLFLRMGENYYNKKQKIRIVLPLAIWADEDVFAYAKKESIPMNQIYGKMKRNGCMFCTGFKNWDKVMEKYNPAIYKFIVNERIKLTSSDCMQAII